MKKVTIQVQETLKYDREIEVEIPDEMTETEFDRLCVAMERVDSLSDALYVLKRNGIKVGQYDEDMNSPDFGEVEVLEFVFED
jgi:hypothetical protein